MQFPYAHATHPQWQMAVGLVLAQLRAQVALGRYASNPTLGILYITDTYAQQLLTFGRGLASLPRWGFGNCRSILHFCVTFWVI